ncbi:MAG: branched-chain amino acid ABC transporter permease [Deltaproteobacteria bacterium]|nr:branched-chain amino acid ABC transporter permease [Deltaproteobacteria bacterium]
MRSTPDYYADVQLLRGRRAWIKLAVLLVVLIVLPLLLPGYRIFTLNYMAVFVIVGLGMNILVGDTGQVSLGHAGFMAIGAYTTVLMMTELGAPFPLALPVGGLVTALFGFLLGLPALRLQGPYLAIVTLGFGLAVTQIIGHSAFFGGHMGLVVPAATLGPISLSGDVPQYYVIVGTTLVLALCARNLSVTRVGRAFRAIRDSEIAAATMGVDVAYYETLSFALSAAFAGIAGGLLALMTGFISPGVFTFLLSLMFLAMVVFGGLGSITGAVLGSLVMGYVNLRMDAVHEIPILGPMLQKFSDAYMSPSGLPNVGWVLTGLMIMLTIMVEPRGLYGVWLRIGDGVRGLRRRGASDDPSAGSG